MAFLPAIITLTKTVINQFEVAVQAVFELASASPIAVITKVHHAYLKCLLKSSLLLYIFLGMITQFVVLESVQRSKDYQRIVGRWWRTPLKKRERESMGEKNEATGQLPML